MKKQNIFEILARQNELTHEDWYKLVETRVEMIKPHLRDLTLRPLGDLKMIHDYFHEHDLKSDTPHVDGEGRFDLETRGIFPCDNNWAGIADTEYHRNDSGRAIATTERLWGFTRNDEWISIEVYITRSQEPYKYEGRTEEVARAQKVIIRKATFQEICDFTKRTPEYFLKQFGKVIKIWASHRGELYRQAQNLEQQIILEESLLDYISKK